MKPVPADIASLFDVFLGHAESLRNAWDSAHEQPPQNPAQLIDAMSQLAGVLRRFDDAQDVDTQELDTLGEYGLQLLSELSELAAQLQQAEAARGLENLCLSLAVWSARHGGEIQHLAPVVNALAFFANHSQTPEDMQMLLGLANEVYEAVNPKVSEDNDRNDPLRPWRLLLLNRAIIATRTLQPTMMEPVFDNVVEHLPEDAARFFTEGMEQMDIVGYPPQVREVMARYYMAFGTPHQLH